MQTTHLIIMAGGIGSRFWPMSTPERPKQFLDLSGCGRTMIQQTLDRFGDIVLPEHVWVVTSKQYALLVKEQLPQIPVNNILQEPCMRNTAPCIAYVTWKIQQKYPDANMIITPSDHLVNDEIEFRRVIHSGVDFVATEDRILTLGMQPTRPETGYGYIQSSGQLMQSEIFKVVAFKEKPSRSTAETYLAEGNFYWNSGLFLWNINTIQKAIRRFVPDIAEIFDMITPAFYTDQEQVVIDVLFPTCPAISIDYAVMEKADSVFVFPADFGWSDLGTWGALHTIASRDADANAVIGANASLIDSSNCMVHLPMGKKIILQGLDGYIVAEHDGVLMICKMEEEQRIKEFSKTLM